MFHVPLDLQAPRARRTHVLGSLMAGTIPSATPLWQFVTSADGFTGAPIE